MDKAFQFQKQARENVDTLKTYITDLQSWETEMKRKEAALNGESEKDLPPVRSKAKKEKQADTTKKLEKRISSSDYKAWENFDADKACKEVDLEGQGPTSLDSKKSEKDKKDKLRQEAQFEKEKGNSFVKEEKWDSAISCYNRAIELVKDDAIYFANRALCHLKKDSLHQAESDCTEALRLDPTYVKALQRRAAAREKLGSLKSASQDLAEVLRLEPNNTAARRQLQVIKERMGSKSIKPKSASTLNATSAKTNPVPVSSELEKWVNGVGENITVIKPVKKPPHLRSKRALKHVNIQEIPIGKSKVDKPKIEIIQENPGHGDSQIDDEAGDSLSDNHPKGDGAIDGPESMKLIDDIELNEKDFNVASMVAPVNSVQFLTEWKSMKRCSGARSDYLNIINPSRLPSIFENALDSQILSELIKTISEYKEKFRDQTVTAYLNYLSQCKRFSTLAMFMSEHEKLLMADLLDYCKFAESADQTIIEDLKMKYEL